MNLHQTWRDALKEEFSKEYFLELEKFLDDEYSSHTIYPKREDIFNAYNLTHLDRVKVVVIGQDPYHGKGQGHGLAFSVQDGIKHPPSLVNIFKELSSDMGCVMPKSGNLTSWAEQGVFLINAVLTVRDSTPNSHKKKGWEKFTDATIKVISQKCEHVVFILWGKPAQSKETLIDKTKHLILKAPHPSPLSSYRGFFGSKPFSLSNKYLRECGKTEIEWSLPSA